jgi:hypothetical protein
VSQQDGILRQIAEIEDTFDPFSKPPAAEHANAAIEHLGGTLTAGPGDDVSAVCYYLTLLAISKFK